jgi:uroporphyrinogen decarboxylase
MEPIQKPLTSENRLDAFFSGQKPDRVPIGSLWMSIGFNTVSTGGTVAEAYDDPDKSFHAFLKVADRFGWDQMFQCYRHTVLGTQDFGGSVRLPKGEYEGALIVVSYPVNSEKDIGKLQMPDPKSAGDIPKAMQFSELQEAYGLPVSFFSRSPFTMAANICGLELFLKWLIKKPELAERLMQMPFEHIINVLGIWVKRFGSDNVFVWMSSPSESNQVISPKHFKQYALPYHLRYHEQLSALGIKRFGFHICGDQNLNLPYLAATAPWIHPSVLSFGHEVDLDTAIIHFPHDIIFGNIYPTALQYESANKIYERSRIALEKGKKAPGGFVLGPGCDIPLMTPPQNLHAMTKAVEDYGWYV